MYNLIVIKHLSINTKHASLKWLTSLYIDHHVYPKLPITKYLSKLDYFISIIFPFVESTTLTASLPSEPQQHNSPYSKPSQNKDPSASPKYQQYVSIHLGG